MVEGAKTVTLEGLDFPVRRTSRSKLHEVDFRFDDHELRGLEQNPKTASRWARLAREGKKIMQFLSGRRYIGVVVDGTAVLWESGTGSTRTPSVGERNSHLTESS